MLVIVLLGALKQCCMRFEANFDLKRLKMQPAEEVSDNIPMLSLAVTIY